MFHNTFGEVVDNKMLATWPSYAGKPIKQEDRAREAFHLRFDKGKNLDAINFVKSMKHDYGDGVSALCVVYNATGETLTLAEGHDWHGHLVPGSTYPDEIKNGQWGWGGGFLHFHSSGAAVGSTAAVVYGGLNKDKSPRDFLIAWDVPWGAAPNKAFCNVASVGTFQDEWAGEEALLSNSNKYRFIDEEGCKAEVKMGNGTSPIFTATLWTHFNELG